MITLKSTGRTFDATSFALGEYSIRDQDGCPITDYDGPELTEEERIEIADRMIAMWTGFRDEIKWR